LCLSMSDLASPITDRCRSALISETQNAGSADPQKFESLPLRLLCLSCRCIGAQLMCISMSGSVSPQEITGRCRSTKRELSNLIRSADRAGSGTLEKKNVGPCHSGFFSRAADLSERSCFFLYVYLWLSESPCNRGPLPFHEVGTVDFSKRRRCWFSRLSNIWVSAVRGFPSCRLYRNAAVL